MAMIVSVHSFRGGTGKSNTTANLACLAALGRKRVGIVDTDIQSPGIHVIFGLDEGKVNRALNDFLWDRCTIGETAYDVSPAPVVMAGGRVFLIPASLKPGEIARVLREGYNVNRLGEGMQELVRHLKLDYLFIDTHPGLNEETLLSVAISDAMVLLLRPDRQDFQGTAVTVEVARKLEVPNMLLVVNKALTSMDFAALAQRVEDTYHAPVAAILPQSEEMIRLPPAAVFSVPSPAPPLPRLLGELARRVGAPVAAA